MNISELMTKNLVRVRVTKMNNCLKSCYGAYENKYSLHLPM